MGLSDHSSARCQGISSPLCTFRRHIRIMSSGSSSLIRWSDLMHPVVAGLISVIVNYGGTFILVFQAAKVAGLSPELTASWVWSVSIGVGLTGIYLSWRFREPIITAWSTPAAAFLV